jgi:hypothetical protein
MVVIGPTSLTWPIVRARIASALARASSAQLRLLFDGLGKCQRCRFFLQWANGFNCGIVSSKLRATISSFAHRRAASTSHPHRLARPRRLARPSDQADSLVRCRLASVARAEGLRETSGSMGPRLVARPVPASGLGILQQLHHPPELAHSTNVLKPRARHCQIKP